MAKKNKNPSQNQQNPSEQKSQSKQLHEDEETTDEILSRIERIETSVQGGKKNRKSQQNTQQQRTNSSSSSGSGPSILSLYFIVPQILVVVLNIAADHFAAPYLTESMRSSSPSNLSAGIPQVRNDLKIDAIAFHAWVWLVFVTAVLKCSRGNVIYGLVYGVVLASALCTNWMIEPLLHGAPIEFLTAYLNFLYVVSKGAIFGEIAVIVASFFVPQTKAKRE